MKKMSLKRMELLLKLLQKYGVTHYQDDKFHINLAFNPPVPQQINVPEIGVPEKHMDQAELPLSMQMWRPDYNG